METKQHSSSQMDIWLAVWLWAFQTLQEENQDYVNVPEVISASGSNPHPHLSTSKQE